MADDLFLIAYMLGDDMRLGLEDNGEIHVVDQYIVPALHWLLRALPAAEVIGRLRDAKDERIDQEKYVAHPPIDVQEVWAAGRTYRSADGNAAIRPHLFFKANGPDVIGDRHPVGIRYDSKNSVAEPELVVVLNSYMEVVGFTIGNDMTARDIAQDPLALPQAKIYARSCAIGPRIWLQPGVTDWPDLTIRVTINRRGTIVFSGSAKTSAIQRPLPELIDYLGRCKPFHNGVMLFSGVGPGVLPPEDFTLQADDEVICRMEPIGELLNSVTVVGEQTAIPRE